MPGARTAAARVAAERDEPDGTSRARILQCLTRSALQARVSYRMGEPDGWKNRSRRRSPFGAAPVRRHGEPGRQRSPGTWVLHPPAKVQCDACV